MSWIKYPFMENRIQESRFSVIKTHSAKEDSTGLLTVWTLDGGKEKKKEIIPRSCATKSQFWCLFTGQFHTVCTVGKKNSSWKYILKRSQLGNTPQVPDKSKCKLSERFNWTSRNSQRCISKEYDLKGENIQAMCSEPRYHNCESTEITNSFFSPAKT